MMWTHLDFTDLFWGCIAIVIVGLVLSWIIECHAAADNSNTGKARVPSSPDPNPDPSSPDSIRFSVRLLMFICSFNSLGQTPPPPVPHSALRVPRSTKILASPKQSDSMPIVPNVVPSGSVTFMTGLRLVNGTYLIDWATIPTNVLPKFTTVNYTNRVPAAPSAIRIAWPVSGTLLSSTDATNWAPERVTLLVSAEPRFTPPTLPRLFRVPLALASLPDTAEIDLAWDGYPEPMLCFTVYCGVEAGMFTNKFEVPFPKTSAHVSGLPLGVTNYFSITVTDFQGQESDKAPQVSYCPPQNFPTSIPVTITAK